MRKLMILWENAAAWLGCMLLAIIISYFASLYLQRNLVGQLHNDYYNGILAELKERIEAGLSLEAELINIPGVANTLRKIQNRERSIYALEILGIDNKVVFSTDLDSIGEVLPIGYIAALRANKSFSNQYETFHVTKFKNSQGIKAGHILLSARKKGGNEIFYFKTLVAFHVMAFIVIMLWFFYIKKLVINLGQCAELKKGQLEAHAYLTRVEKKLAHTLMHLQELADSDK